MTVSVTRKARFILMMNPPFLGAWYAWRLAKKKPPADRPTGRPADRHAPWNYVCLRKFFKQKAVFFILSTPPFDFVRVYEARSLSQKLVNMSLF